MNEALRVEKYYSPQYVADLLDVSLKTIYRRIDRGEIAPVIKLSRSQLRIPDSAIMRLLENNKVRNA